MTNDNAQPQTRREAFEAALAGCYEVEILVVDTGAELPENVWQSHPEVHERFCFLRYGLDMQKPIPDLVIDATGIHATLSFACTPIKTFVPWEAVATIVGMGERPKQRAQLRAV